MIEQAPSTQERPSEAVEHEQSPTVFGSQRPGYTQPMSMDVRYAAKQGYAGTPLGGQHKVVGFISWLTIALCIVGIFRFPGRLSMVVMLVVAYFFARMAFTVFFDVIGSIRTREWGRRDWQAPDVESWAMSKRWRDASPPFTSAEVHHVVLLPNYKESLGVLEATLDGLAAQDGAKERLTVVLAMEAKEPGSAEKGAKLAERYANGFESVIVTLHPANLPGEIACKGSNQAWAAREAKRYLVDERAIPIERITVTSCDADSILHRNYLAALGRMFAADVDRHAAFWQAPMFYYNNLWKVPVPVRFMAYFTHALFMGELANPLARPLPLSTYSLSMKMLHETGYWDPAVISEDWHIFLQAYFTRRGDVRTRRIFLPTSADMPDGETPWKAILNMYHQSIRHSWGAEDVGFILQRWPRSRVPALRTARLFEHVLRDHLMRSVPWFVFTAASILSFMTMRGLNPMPLRYPELALALRYLWLSSTFGMMALLLIELWRCPPPRISRLPARIAEMCIAYVLLPAISLGFGTVPALYAQTKLMLGLGLSWRVTPKRLAAQLEES